LLVPIRESGFYRLSIMGTPGTRGYEVSYDVSWRVR
jgi:hypothetical protein